MLNPYYLYKLIKEYLDGTRKELGTYIVIFLMVLALQVMVYGMVLSVVGKVLPVEPIYAYSTGTMKAKSAKISEKGLIWKTKEGYILTGSLSEGVADKWFFSTRKDEVVTCIKNNDFVELTYIDYLWVPFHVGSRSHIVTECKGI